MSKQQHKGDTFKQLSIEFEFDLSNGVPRNRSLCFGRGPDQESRGTLSRSVLLPKYRLLLEETSSDGGTLSDRCSLTCLKVFQCLKSPYRSLCFCILHKYDIILHKYYIMLHKWRKACYYWVMNTCVYDRVTDLHKLFDLSKSVLWKYLSVSCFETWCLFLSEVFTIIF